MRKKKLSDGYTVLHMAASNNDIQLLDYTLSSVFEDKKGFVNQQNNEGWSAAHFAAFMSNIDSMSFLVEHGANLLLPSSSQMTPIDEIIRNDHKDMLSCVYEHVKYRKRDVSDPKSFGYLHLAAG